MYDLRWTRAEDGIDMSHLNTDWLHDVIYQGVQLFYFCSVGISTIMK
jgi:hypothetical protein